MNRSIAIIKGRLYYDEFPFSESIFIDLLSGFFPKVLKRKFCKKSGSDCKLCEFNKGCAYSYIFEPILIGDKSLVVSLPDVKVPFAFRWNFEKGDGKFFLTLFDGCMEYSYEIIQTLIEIGQVGLGYERMRFSIGGLKSVDYRYRELKDLRVDKGLMKNLDPFQIDNIKGVAADLPSLSMKLEFMSDVDLSRSQKKVKNEDLFGILYRRIRDRMQALYVIYLDEELPIEMKGLSDKSRAVIMTSENKNCYEFKGKISFFRYLFLLGSYLNVGRRCAFGNGVYRIIF